MAKKNSLVSKEMSTAQQTKKHHYVRTLISAFCGFIALNLIIYAIILVWVNNTLTSTNNYVEAVAPLASDTVVQDFIADKATEGILKNSDDEQIKGMAETLLTPQQRKDASVAQLKTMEEPVLRSSFKEVVSSKDFATLWEKTNRDIHAQLVQQLESDSKVAKLNFRPTIDGSIELLGKTKFSSLQKNIELKQDVGLVTLEGEQVETAKTAYRDFKKVVIGLIIVAFLLLVLTVDISTHHMKTFRRMMILTGISTGVLAALLTAASEIRQSQEIEAQFAAALIKIITHDLRMMLFVIAGTCISVTLGSKVIAMVAARQHHPKPAK